MRRHRASPLLRGQRRRHRAPCRSGRRKPPASLRIRNRGRIETRQRHHDRLRIALDLRSRSARARRPAACGLRSSPRATSSGVRFWTRIAALLVGHGRLLALSCPTCRARRIAEIKQPGAGCVTPIEWALQRPSRGTRRAPVARERQTVTCVPTSTTRPVGIWKKSVASLAILASPMNRRSCHARHAGMRRRLERAPRQEERRRHDVERPAVLARDGQRLRHVGRFHVAEPQRHPAEMRRQRRHRHPLVFA